MGGQNVFQGGRHTIERALQTSFGGFRKWDSSGLCPLPLSKKTGCEQTGSGKRVIRGETNGVGGNVSYVGGSKTISGEGVYDMVSPPLSFPPLLPLSDTGSSSYD